MKPLISLVAIVSEDGFISKNEGVPWRLPADVNHFRQYTNGKWLLIGRKTFQEMLGWFRPGHKPLVLSRDKSYLPAHGERVGSIEEAITKVAAAGGDELAVLGGAQAFGPAMRYADRLVLTRVRHRLGQGVPFPPFDPLGWTEVSRMDHPVDNSHSHPFSIVTLVRRV